MSRRSPSHGPGEGFARVGPPARLPAAAGPERRAEPRDDVITKAVTGTVDGVGLYRPRSSAPPPLLPPAAETTRAQWQHFFALLAERGAPRARARRPRARAWAVEGRSAGRRPSVRTARQATRPIEIAGVHIPGGVRLRRDRSGNRDETHYPPGPLRPGPSRRRHLSFGFGRHFCLGYHLAKMERARRSARCSTYCRGCGWTGRGAPRITGSRSGRRRRCGCGLGSVRQARELNLTGCARSRRSR